MINHFLKVLALTYVMFLFIGCTEKKIAAESFFETLEKELNGTKILHDLKFLEQDSMQRMLPVFRGTSRKIAYEKGYMRINGWDNLVDLLIGPDIQNQDLVLLFAFRSYLNKRKVNFDEAQEQAKNMKDRLELEMIKGDSIALEELKSIIALNDFIWNKGDTLELTFHLNSEEDCNYIFYLRYPNSLTFSLADDTLNMKGVLLDKFYSRDRSGNAKTNPKDVRNLFFKLEIVDLNPLENICESAKILGIGQNYDLHLESYGRSIPPAARKMQE
ncbi:MAG: hypothetical protein KI786_15470 [Mameliella sp.]|nr:hypothetical protein [Phaeodactylibacter sp.]